MPDLSTSEYKPRFTFEITEEQQARANILLATYGQRKSIFGKILDDVLDAIEVNQGMALGLLMSNKVVMKGIMTILSEGMIKSKKGKSNG